MKHVARLCWEPLRVVLVCASPHRAGQRPNPGFRTLVAELPTRPGMTSSAPGQQGLRIAGCYEPVRPREGARVEPWNA
jgi:hypothetical protein